MVDANKDKSTTEFKRESMRDTLAEGAVRVWLDERAQRHGGAVKVWEELNDHQRNEVREDMGKALDFLAGAFPVTLAQFAGMVPPVTPAKEREVPFIGTVETVGPGLRDAVRVDELRQDTRLCDDCPPVDYPTNVTRCQTCPRAEAAETRAMERAPYQPQTVIRVRGPGGHHSWRNTKGELYELAIHTGAHVIFEGPDCEG
jgi:hypothetical protein